MQKQYKLTGIVRNIPHSVVTDFSCAEMINLREKDGVWRATGEKKELMGYPNPMPGNGINNYIKMFRHQFDDVDNFIFYNQHTGEISAIPAHALPYKKVIVIDSYYEAGAPVFKISNSVNVSDDNITIHYGLKGSGVVNTVLLPKGQREVNAPISLNNDDLGKFYAYITDNIINGTCYVIHRHSDFFTTHFPGEYVIGTIAANKDVSFVSVGGFIVATTDNNVYYFRNALRQIDNYSYNDYLLLPGLPVLNISPVLIPIYKDGDDTIFKDRIIPSSMYGTCFIMAAYRLSTGQLICHSPIKYIQINHYVKIANLKGTIHETAFYISLGINSIDDIVPEEWKDIITSIDIFMSEPALQEIKGENVTNHAPYEINEYVEKFGDLFFKVKEFKNINDNDYYPTSNKETFMYVNLPEKDVFVTKERLPVFENRIFKGESQFVYNSRLYIGNVSSLLPASYNYSQIQEVNHTSNYEYFFKTTIKTDSGFLDVLSAKARASGQFTTLTGVNFETGTSFSYKGYTTISNQASIDCVIMPAILGYPDRRAVKTALYAREISEDEIDGGSAWLLKEWELKPLSNINYSYALTGLLQSIYDNCILGYSSSADIFNPSFIHPSYNYYISIDTSTQKQIVTSSNKMLNQPSAVKASDIFLPFIYPVDKSYIVGNKKVIGFSANNLSIDASNFGIYPVFVFSENGVYAMELGTGDTLVTRIVPLSGDVCIDKNSITNIGGATLFASKDGLRILQGQRSQKLTTLLENYTGNPLSGNRHFEAILAKYGMGAFISGYADFQDFLNGAKTYLHYKENEVVITNEAYPYSYVLRLPKATEGGGIRIYKIAERYYNILYDYPNAYGMNADGSVIYDIGSEQLAVGSSSKQSVFVQTNAFKLGTDEFEMIRRLIARIRLSAFTGGQRIGAYLFVSNDTRQWAWGDGCEITAQNAPMGAQNFAPLRCPASVKYGILVIAGAMDRVQDCLTHVSVEYEKRYENKIR
jgi:hypothetical protein